MNYEKFKSILLTVLVAISIFLTYSLWTYQPRYETIEDQDSPVKVTVGEKRPEDELVPSLIKPFKLLYHQADKTLGTSNQKEIDKVMEDIGTWNVYDFSQVQLNEQDLKEVSKGENRIEIIFPDNVPLSVYSQILNLDSSSVPKADFDRLIIDLNDKGLDSSAVFFLPKEADKGGASVYTARVDQNSVNAFASRYLKKLSLQYTEYMEYALTDDRTIYLPLAKDEYISYQYFTDLDSIEDYKNALFIDGKSINLSSNGNVDTYISVYNLMTVNKNYNTLSFVYPTEEKADPWPSSYLLTETMSFVNDHGGWTDKNFQYFSINPDQNKVTYRLFVQNLPVFNDQGMAEITETVGNSSVSKYSRPYFTLDFSSSDFSSSAVSKEKLPSGSSVITMLQDAKSIDLDSVQDIVVGYKMTRNPEDSRKLNFEPSWYYKYDGNWIRLDTEQKEDVLNGLE